MAINKLDTGAIQDNAITNAKMADDAVGVADLAATGTPSSTTFLRGDNAWVTPTDTNTTYSVQDGELSQNNFTNDDHTKLNNIEASADVTDATNVAAAGAVMTQYVHPNHSGEVTSTADGATVIVDNIVDEANLKVSNSATNGQFLSAQSGNTGGLTWAAVPATSTADIRTAATLQLTATSNIGLGTSAVNSITTGDYNVGVGDNALDATTTGAMNTAVGHLALGSNTEGSYNTALGRASMQSNTTGTLNVAVGLASLDANISGNNNVAVGKDAMYRNTTGSDNTANGYQSLYNNTTAASNTSIGYGAMLANTTGADNVAVGRQALTSNTTAANNTAVGMSALILNTTGTGNTAIGNASMYYNVGGGNNTAVGMDSLNKNTTGSHNTAMGKNALDASTTGNNHTAFGQEALAKVTTGSNNQGIGRDAGSEITTGSNNVCLGTAAGDGITTGDTNVCVGYQAGAVTTGSNQLYIARSNANQGNNPVWIYGDASGNVIQGNNSTSWSQASDERIKKNITDSSDGLAKIDALQVRNFEYRTDAEITVEGLTGIDKAGVQVGAIAQEVEVVLPTAVHIGNGTQKQLKTDPIFWAMVKAIQELSTKNDALEARITALEA